MRLKICFFLVLIGFLMNKMFSCVEANNERVLQGADECASNPAKRAQASQCSQDAAISADKNLTSAGTGTEASCLIGIGQKFQAIGLCVRNCKEEFSVRIKQCEDVLGTGEISAKRPDCSQFNLGTCQTLFNKAEKSHMSLLLIAATVFMGMIFFTLG